MSLSVTRDGIQRVALDNKGFDEARSAFRLDLSDGSGASVFIPHAHPHQPGVPYGDYIVFLLFRAQYSENDIFEVQKDDRRIGWLFPLQAALSTEHTQANNVTFIRFVQGGLYALCDGQVKGYVKTPTYGAMNELKITDFYSEDSFLCVLYAPALVDPAQFKIEEYLPCLFRYGFYLQSPDRDPASVLNETSNALYSQLQKRITLEQTSSHLTGHAFVHSLLRDTLPYENDRLLAFFYQYQLIELLLERVLNARQKRFATDAAAIIASASSLKDIIEEFQREIGEKARLHRLFAHHLKSQPDCSALRILCNDFLKNHEADPTKYSLKQNFPDYLYPVRNMIFHNFRLIEDAKPIIGISDALKPVVSELLISYKE